MISTAIKPSEAPCSAKDGSLMIHTGASCLQRNLQCRQYYKMRFTHIQSNGVDVDVDVDVEVKPVLDYTCTAGSVWRNWSNNTASIAVSRHHAVVKLVAAQMGGASLLMVLVLAYWFEVASAICRSTH